jgi:hypothetical protein
LRYQNAYEGDGWSYVATKPGTLRNALTGDLLYANGGKPGAATGAALGAIPERPGIGHNNPPPTVRINGKEVEIDPSRISGRYSNNADLNEALLRSGGDIDHVINGFKNDLQDFEKSKHARRSWYDPTSHKWFADLFAEAEAYKAGIGKASTLEQRPVDSMPFEKTWFHSTNAAPFDALKASDEGLLGPGVYLGRDKALTKSHIPSPNGGEGPRRVHGVEYRGEMLPYRDYLRLAEDVSQKTGIEAGSTEMTNALAPMLRQYGYSGVKDRSPDYGAFGSVFNPADTRIASTELYANGGLGGSALNALLQSYGLGAPQSRPASPRYRPGDA